MDPRGLVTGGIRFNHIPAEQREYFVKPGVPVQVGIVEVGIAAVAEPNVRRNQREPWFGVLTNTIPVLVEEGRSDDICLPLARGNLAQILGCAAAQADRGRKAIHQHIVPLVKDGQSPDPIGKTRESERSIGVALGKGEVFAVRIAKAYVALGEGETVVCAAAEESFIGCTAHAFGSDDARHCVVAITASDVRVGAAADARQAAIDDSGIGKADGHVPAGWTVLLEVGWFTDSQPGIVRLLAVQGVGLQPLFSSRNPVSRGSSHDAVPSLHHVRNQGLAGKRGGSYAVRFVLRAGHNSARNADRA